LIYRILLSAEAGEPQVSFDQGVLSVRLPERLGRDWAGSDEVGIYASTSWGLRLAMEKDFRCLDAGARDEDESHAFDHPGAAAGAGC
jgi:hypothetical protein